MNTTINEVEYSIGKLNAFEQLHVARKLAPFLAHVFPALAKLSKQDQSESVEIGDVIMEIVAGPIADVFCKMDKEDVDFVVNTCLSVCQRKQAKGWAKVMQNGQLMFADIELDALLGLTIAAVQENLGRFFPTSQPGSDTTA